METYSDGDIENERELRTFEVWTVDGEELVGRLEDMRDSGYDLDWGEAQAAEFEPSDQREEVETDETQG